MVVLTGVAKNNLGEFLGFYYNDPAKTIVEEGKDQFVDYKDFIEYWRKMAIFVKPK